MISVSLNKLGKKFNREWIFRDLSYDITPGTKMVILGGNGSGKSTLLQVISGFVTPNEGKLQYQNNGQAIEPDDIKNHISLASPALQLVEDYTLNEMVEHAGKFKPFLNNLTVAEITSLIQLEPAAGKPIAQFSSGMKQRVKLGLALLADTGVVLLDEPVSHFDRDAIGWYKQLINDYAGNRTVIVCSNAITEEYFFCDKEINVSEFKGRR